MPSGWPRRRLPLSLADNHLPAPLILMSPFPRLQWATATAVFCGTHGAIVLEVRDGRTGGQGSVASHLPAEALDRLSSDAHREKGGGEKGGRGGGEVSELCRSMSSSRFRPHPSQRRLTSIFGKESGKGREGVDGWLLEGSVKLIKILLSSSPFNRSCLFCRARAPPGPYRALGAPGDRASKWCPKTTCCPTSTLRR